MEAIFLKILNLSITASWLILGAILVRFLFKKAPKSLRFVIWALVGARLLFPISPESVLSLIPSAEPIPQEILTSSTPQIHSGINAVNQFINPIISEALTPSVPQSVTGAQSVAPATPMQTLTHVASIVWICGMILMLGYALISYLILRRRVAASVYSESGAYICDEIDSPFVLGIIKPRIYMPSALDQKQSEHVLSHEKAHIRRRDHWWKPLSFVLLAIYWFNPLIWVAYVLLCRDIELACDERVARNMTELERADYSSTLLELSIPRKMITACPVAFGEVSVKSRIRSVLSYKKPTLWIIIAALVACAVLTVTLFANPVDKEEEKDEPKQEETGKEKDEKEETPSPISEWDKKYTGANYIDPIVPNFYLNETEKRYLFVYSAYSSHISSGSYALDQDKLTLIEDGSDNRYVFRTDENGYVFDAAASTPLPEYVYREGDEPEPCIIDGTLFRINEMESEICTDKDEYWILDRKSNGYYRYIILGANKNSIITYGNFDEKPDVSYLGNGIVRVTYKEGSSIDNSFYVNIRNGEKSQTLTGIIAENSVNTTVVCWYGSDSVFVRDMFDANKLNYRAVLPDASQDADNLILSCVINDDKTVNLSYTLADGKVKEIVIDEISSFVPELLYSGDGVELYCLDSLNSVYMSNKEFLLKYNGKEQGFTGVHSRAFDPPTVYVEDLTGDGIPEITVIMPYGQGMGPGCNLDVHVFDSADLSQYSFTPIADIIAQNTEFSSDDGKYYVEFKGESYVFDSANIFGMTAGAEICTENFNKFDVSDGKLVCVTSCDVNAYGFATIRTEYRFDGEKFVFGSMTIEPHEEYTIENENASAETTPDTAAPAAKPNRAPETNVNTNTNTNTNTNINNNTSTQTPPAPETSAPSPAPAPDTASGLPQTPENTSLQIGGVSSYYDDFEFGRTYSYSYDEKVYEPRNREVPFNSEIGEEQDESEASEPSVEIISLIP